MFACGSTVTWLTRSAWNVRDPPVPSSFRLYVTGTGIGITRVVVAWLIALTGSWPERSVVMTDERSENGSTSRVVATSIATLMLAPVSIGGGGGLLRAA